MRKKYAWASSFISELDWLDHHQRLDDRSSVIKRKRANLKTGVSRK